MGLFGRGKKKSSDDFDKWKKNKDKAQIKEVYKQELQKARISEAKKRARHDAKKPSGFKGFAQSMNSGFGAIGAGFENMNKTASKLFSDDMIGVAQKKSSVKKKKNPKRKTVYEY